MLILCLPLWATNLFAQDTIVGWTFPSGSADSIVDVSISSNSSRFISAQYGTWGSTTTYHSIPTYYTNGSLGAPDSAATSTGWNNGVDSSYWMVKCKTPGYGSIKLYSKQSSGGSNPGPRDFKVQYKLSGTTMWTDITGGTVVCANDWTSGVLNGIDIPAVCNNQTNSVSIRWVMTSNFNTSGGTVASTGIAKIDNVIVTGTLLTGIESNVNQNAVSIYPNPNNGNFIIENTNNIKFIRIFNAIGKLVFETETTYDNRINLSGFEKGLYLIQLINMDNDLQISKVIVE
jgi:hypothetical protein